MSKLHKPAPGHGDDLQTQEQGRTDRGSILRALRRCKLMLVDEIWDKKLRDYDWATNPERMGR